jgi:hypothetical protein
LQALADAFSNVAVLTVYEGRHRPQYSYLSALTLSAAISVEVTHAVFRIIVDPILRVLPSGVE